MRTFEFESDKIKSEYKRLLAIHPALSSIINTLKKDKSIIKIIGVINSNTSDQLVIYSGDDVYYVYIDLLDKKIVVYNKEKTYGIAYDDLVKRQVFPVHYEYHNGIVIVKKKNIFDEIEETVKRNVYEIKNKNNSKIYTMIVSYQNNLFQNDDFIDYLLNRCDISNIRTLFISISKYLNYNLCDLKLTDENGSIIVIEKSLLKTYIEYQECNDKYNKIYLENDEFFIEKIVKEKYDDVTLHLLKKIGENNGKEKE